MKKIAEITLAVLVMSPAPAFAYDWSGGAKVTLIEATYAPGTLPFQVDRTMGSCSAGTMLVWNPQGADAATKAQNYQAILATLMTAKSTGQAITIFGNNGSCTIDFLYLS